MIPTLPAEIVLCIFLKLPLKVVLTSCARVCFQWYEVSQTSSLYHTIYVRDYQRITMKQLFRLLLKNPKTLHIHGNVKRSPGEPVEMKQGVKGLHLEHIAVFDNAFLKQVLPLCHPRFLKTYAGVFPYDFSPFSALRELYLYNQYRDLTFELPPHLRILVIEGWSEDEELFVDRLPRSLEHVSIRQRITTQTLLRLVDRCPLLVTLHIQLTMHHRDQPLSFIPPPQLRHLSLSRSTIIDHIFQVMPSLTVLDLSDETPMDTFVVPLREMVNLCPHLEVLSATVFNIQQSLTPVLHALPRDMKYLELYTLKDVEELKVLTSRCPHLVGLAYVSVTLIHHMVSCIQRLPKLETLGIVLDDETWDPQSLLALESTSLKNLIIDSSDTSFRIPLKTIRCFKKWAVGFKKEDSPRDSFFSFDMLSKATTPCKDFFNATNLPTVRGSRLCER